MISEKEAKALANKLLDEFERVTDGMNIRIATVEKMRGYCFYQIRDGIEHCHGATGDVIPEYIVLKMMNVLEFKKFSLTDKPGLYERLMERFMDVLAGGDDAEGE